MEALANFKQLEEGEIDSVDSFDEIYTPLERPTWRTTVTAKTFVESDADDNEQASSSDSDSSTGKGSPSKVRKKIKSTSLSSNKPETKKKKNCQIWCKVLEAESITSNLTNCNLDESQKRIRGLVPYDYTFKQFPKNNKILNNDQTKGKVFEYSNKRNYDGHYINNKKIFSDNLLNNKLIKGVSKNIAPLSDSAKESDEKLAKEITTKLGEAKEDLVLRAIKIAGKEAVLAVYEETRQVEKSGGLLIMNGSRRRSSGGVFFYLLKTTQDISNEKQKEIFLEDKRNTSVQKKMTARQMRKMRSAQFKEALKKDDFPTLLSRTELAIRQYKERMKAEENSEVENPPPSPATDGRDCSTDGEEEKCADNIKRESEPTRNLTTYDDLFGNVGDDMEMI